MLSKPSLRWVFIASGITLVLIAALSFKFLIPTQQQSAEGQLPPPQVLGIGGVNFKTYKGLNFPWGLSSGGVSTYIDWLSTKYDEAVMASSFEEIKKMGVLTVGKFLFLDRMLVKDSNWGTDAYVTQWNPAYKANWEGLLKNVVKPRGMELVVTLLNPASDTDRDPTSFERSTFEPVVSGSDLVGPTTNNGNMETGTGSLPDSWTLYRGDPANTASWQTSGGQTNGSDRYVRMTSNSTQFTQLSSPSVPLKRGDSILFLSTYFKGEVQQFMTQYLDASNKVLAYDNPAGFRVTASSWTKRIWASREGSDVPFGTEKIRIAMIIEAGKTADLDSVQIAPGARNAKWRNYIQAVKDWVSMYSSNTEYGSAVVSWIGIKEVYDGVPPIVAHPFSRDLYQAIKATGTTQTVGIDSSPLEKLPVTDPANLGWYNDAADFYSIHIYKNDGILPDTSKLDKPFILGEFGADWKCPNGGIPPTNCAWTEVPMTNPVLNLTATSNLYQNALAAGAKTALAWEWVNRTVATHTGGVHTLGPVGQWIRDWNPAGSTPPPVPTPSPASATFSLQSGTNYTQGVQIPVTVMAETSTDSANTFVSKINFPADLLSVGTIDTTGSFITNWTERYYDNTLGAISLVGAIPNPGYKTTGSPALLATVYFTSKALGTANFTFDPTSVIYRNSDNTNILAKTTGTSITVNPSASPIPTPTPTPTPTPIPTPIPTPVSIPVPANLTASAASYNKVNLAWDSAGITGITYWIIRDNVTIAKTTTESYSDTTVSPSTGYSYQVVAADTSGSNSPTSNTATVTTPAVPDTTPPATPANLTASTISAYQINLSWTASTDNIGITDYDIYQNGALLTSVSGATTTFGSSGLTPGGTYSYYVVARDAAGNLSPASNTETVTTPSLASPSPAPIAIKGDFSRDDVINLLDHSILLSNWGKAKANFNPIDVDLNSDGVLNVFDFAILKQILIDNNIIRVNP